MTRSWGIKFSRPSNKQLNNSHESNHQEPAPLPKAIGSFNVDTSAPRLTGFVDASFGSDLRKRRSITGFAFTFSGGAIAHGSKTQTLAAGSSTEAEFTAAHDAAKVAKHLRCASRDLGYPQDGPTEMRIDNEAALKITNNNQAPTIQTRQ